MSAKFAESDLNALQAALESALGPELGKPAAPAVESIEVLAGISFVATHILLPILVGMTDKLLYEKLKGMRTAAEAKAAKHAVLDPGRPPAQSAPKDQIRSDMIEKLVAEGISKKAAKRIVDKVVRAAEARLRGGG